MRVCSVGSNAVDANATCRKQYTASSIAMLLLAGTTVVAVVAVDVAVVEGLAVEVVALLFVAVVEDGGVADVVVAGTAVGTGVVAGRRTRRGPALPAGS